MTRKTVSDIILDDMKRRISNGEFSNDEKLPTERMLAEYYNSSRIPVRTALKQLAEEGVVITKPGVGTFVNQQKVSYNENSISTPYLKNEHILTETLKIRRLIECECARLAAVNYTPEGLKKLEKALFKTITEIRKLKAEEENDFFKADNDFHRVIAELSQNQFLINCFDAMPELISLHQYWSLKYATQRDEVIAYHTQIFESIINNNAQKASECMYNHLIRVESLIKKMPIEQLDVSNLTTDDDINTEAFETLNNINE